MAQTKKAIFTGHAVDRMGDRKILPFAVNLCCTFGKWINKNTKLLKTENIPDGLLKSLKHSLRNRIDHQLPLVVVYDASDSMLDEQHMRVITTYRYDGKQKLNKKRTLGTFLTKNSTFQNSYDFRHRAF